MTSSESQYSPNNHTEWEDRGQRVQFSLGGLMVLMAIIAGTVTAARWFFGWLEEPITFLVAWGLGAFVGIGIVLAREHAPRTRILNVLLVVFVVINWGWLPGGNAGYLVGLVCGVLLAWRGEMLANVVLRLCGFTLSKPSLQQNSLLDEELNIE